MGARFAPEDPDLTADQPADRLLAILDSVQAPSAVRRRRLRLAPPAPRGRRTRRTSPRSAPGTGVRGRYQLIARQVLRSLQAASQCFHRDTSFSCHDIWHVGRAGAADAPDRLHPLGTPTKIVGTIIKTTDYPRASTITMPALSRESVINFEISSSGFRPNFSHTWRTSTTW